MNHEEYLKYYNSLDNNLKELIDRVIYSTMNMCSELVDEPLYFNDKNSFDDFRESTLIHLIENEFYDFNSKKWIKIETLTNDNIFFN